MIPSPIVVAVCRGMSKPCRCKWPGCKAAGDFVPVVCVRPDPDGPEEVPLVRLTVCTVCEEHTKAFKTKDYCQGSLWVMIVSKFQRRKLPPPRKDQIAVRYDRRPPKVVMPYDIRCN
jgi:hypothetical protein